MEILQNIKRAFTKLENSEGKQNTQTLWKYFNI